MSQELFYTSAPSGLRPGSRGFCTVMSTSGMAKNLADRLEALSGYRHVFAPNDPQAALNPVAYSHLKINVGGIPLHVLSRISAAGLDYTQRSNKFAHHVVLDGKELVSGGPAALLASPGFTESTWSGEPRVIGLGRKPPSVQASPAVCQTWAKLTGDAGWGGVLAETALAGPSKVATVIFEPGMDTLALIAESLALLPEPLRWQVTFSTYFTKLPPEVQCQWRFVLKGSPEAKVAERGGGCVIALGTPAPAKGLEASIAAAREGRSISGPQATTVEPRIAPMTNDSSPVSSEAVTSLTSNAVFYQRAHPSFPDYLTRPTVQRSKGIKWLIPIVAGLMFAILAGGGYIVVASWRTGKSRVVSAEQLNSAKPPAQPAKLPATVDKGGPSDGSHQPAEIGVQPISPPEPPTPVQLPTEPQEPVVPKNEEPLPVVPAVPTTLPNNLGKSIKTIPFELPSLPSGGGLAPDSGPQSSTITIDSQLAAGELRLLGGDSAHSNWTFEILPEDAGKAGYRILMKPREETKLVPEKVIASLVIGNQSLSFAWNRRGIKESAGDAKIAVESLKNCVVILEVPGRRVGYALRTPVEADAISPSVGGEGVVVVKQVNMIPQSDVKVFVDVPVLPPVWTKHLGTATVDPEHSSVTIAANLAPVWQHPSHTRPTQAQLNLTIVLELPKQSHQPPLIRWKCRFTIDGAEKTVNDLKGEKTVLDGNIRSENPGKLEEQKLPQAARDKIIGYKGQIANLDSYLLVLDEIEKSPISARMIALVGDAEVVLAEPPLGDKTRP